MFCLETIVALNEAAYRLFLEGRPETDAYPLVGIGGNFPKPELCKEDTSEE